MNILDKVYDRYEEQDFTPRMAHLNPVREINFGIRSDIEDEISNKIRRRVEKIKEAILPILETPELPEIITMPFAQRENNVTSGLPPRMVDAMYNSGGPRGPGLLGLLGPFGDSPFVQDPLSLEIDLLLMSIPASALGGLSDPFGNWGNDVDPSMPPPELFVLDCSQVATTGDIDTGLGGNNEDDDEDEDDDDGSNDGRNAGDGDIMDNDQLLNSLIAQLEYQDLLDGIQDQNDLAKCAAKELGILKIILKIIRVISAMKEIISMVLDIVMMIMDTVQLAAGAWLNPTNIAKIAQRLAQKLLAIAISLLAELLGKLWEKLNLDCIIAQAMEVIAEISSAIAGIASIYAMVKTDAISFISDEWLSKVKDPFDELVKTIKEFDIKEKAKETWDELKGDMSKLAKQYSNPNVYGNAVMQAIPPGAMQAVAAMKQATETTKQAMALIASMRKGTGTADTQTASLAGLESY